MAGAGAAPAGPDGRRRLRVEERRSAAQRAGPAGGGGPPARAAAPPSRRAGYERAPRAQRGRGARDLGPHRCKGSCALSSERPPQQRGMRPVLCGVASLLARRGAAGRRDGALGRGDRGNERVSTLGRALFEVLRSLEPQCRPRGAGAEGARRRRRMRAALVRGDSSGLEWWAACGPPFLRACRPGRCEGAWLGPAGAGGPRGPGGRRGAARLRAAWAARGGRRGRARPAQAPRWPRRAPHCPRRGEVGPPAGAGPP
jgi:hypothetical protein